MTWKRAGEWGLWVVLAVVPGGLFVLAVVASWRAVRARLEAPDPAAAR